MKTILLFALLGFATVTHAASPEKNNVLTWPRTKVDRFGCFLEKQFGYKDKKFNCGLKKYRNAGDPCKKVDAWMEGPTLPDRVAKRVNPLIKSIVLSWEHGELQGVNIEFTQKMTEAKIREILKVPALNQDNISSLSIQECSTEATCLVLQGFDHVGAGDADCGNNK
jgi:hypothetical protein